MLTRGTSVLFTHPSTKKPQQRTFFVHNLAGIKMAAVRRTKDQLVVRALLNVRALRTCGKSFLSPEGQPTIARGRGPLRAGILEIEAQKRRGPNSVRPSPLQ